MQDAGIIELKETKLTKEQFARCYTMVCRTMGPMHAEARDWPFDAAEKQEEMADAGMRYILAVDGDVVAGFCACKHDDDPVCEDGEETDRVEQCVYVTSCR